MLFDHRAITVNRHVQAAAFTDVIHLSPTAHPHLAVFDDQEGVFVNRPAFGDRAGIYRVQQAGECPPPAGMDI